MTHETHKGTLIEVRRAMLAAELGCLPTEQMIRCRAALKRLDALIADLNSFPNNAHKRAEIIDQATQEKK